MNNIEGKVVIITGASSGIGEATAKKSGNLDAKIVLAARRKERLEVLKKQIEQNGGTAVYKVTDVADQLFSDKSKMITPEQIADAVIYSIEQPEHTMVTSVVIQPNL